MESISIKNFRKNILESGVSKQMNYPVASYGVSRTCPPLPRMLAFNLVAVPGDGRRV